MLKDALRGIKFAMDHGKTSPAEVREIVEEAIRAGSGVDPKGAGRETVNLAMALFAAVEAMVEVRVRRF